MHFSFATVAAVFIAGGGFISASPAPGQAEAATCNRRQIGSVSSQLRIWYQPWANMEQRRRLGRRTDQV